MNKKLSLESTIGLSKFLKRVTRIINPDENKILPEEKDARESAIMLIINGYYDLDYTLDKKNLNRYFLAQSCDAVVELIPYVQTDSGNQEKKEFFGIRHAVLPLFHYPIVTGTITLDDFRTLEKYRAISKIVDDDWNLTRTFEKYLPWNELFYSFPKDNPIAKTDFWEKITSDNKPYAFMAIAGSPNIVTTKIVERLYLLKYIINFNLDETILEQLAEDSRVIHATVAEMLGMWKYKWRIEDYYLKIVNNAAYFQITQDLEENRPTREARVERAIKIISDRLVETTLDIEVTGRPKHIYSIFQKTNATGLSVSEVNDIQGIRIIVQDAESESKTEEYCWEIYSMLTEVWEVANGVYEEGKLFRDWISNPKPNGYQSIHTTVMFEEKMLEVQIRSQSMHDLAENGVAAHWLYKKAGKSTSPPKKFSEYADKIKAFSQHNKTE